MSTSEPARSPSLLIDLRVDGQLVSHVDDGRHGIIDGWLMPFAFAGTPPSRVYPLHPLRIVHERVSFCRFARTLDGARVHRACSKSLTLCHLCRERVRVSVYGVSAAAEQCCE